MNDCNSIPNYPPPPQIRPTLTNNRNSHANPHLFIFGTNRGPYQNHPKPRLRPRSTSEPRTKIKNKHNYQFVPRSYIFPYTTHISAMLGRLFPAESNGRAKRVEGWGRAPPFWIGYYIYYIYERYEPGSARICHIVFGPLPGLLLPGESK